MRQKRNFLVKIIQKVPRIESSENQFSQPKKKDDQREVCSKSNHSKGRPTHKREPLSTARASKKVAIHRK